MVENKIDIISSNATLIYLAKLKEQSHTHYPEDNVSVNECVETAIKIYSKTAEKVHMHPDPYLKS